MASRYPAPRHVDVSVAEIMSVTVLEAARASALAGVALADMPRLLRAVVAPGSAPADTATGTLVLYALAYQLERRVDPAVTWEAAQTWDLGLRADAAADLERATQQAEARAEADASLATGVPVEDHARDLTWAQVEALGAARADVDRRARAATHTPPRRRGIPRRR